MNTKTKASLIIFTASIPVGAVNIWLMHGGQSPSGISFAEYFFGYIARCIGFALGVSLIPVLVVFLRQSPLAGYISAAVINVLLIFGATNVASHKENAEAITSPKEVKPDVRVLVSSQSADGVVQTDLNQVFLGNFETYTVALTKKKAEEYLASTGKSDVKVNLHSQANYIEHNGVKLGIVKIATESVFNQAVIFGIVGSDLKRVICVNNSGQAVAISYGECGNTLNKVFGVNLDISK